MTTPNKLSAEELSNCFAWMEESTLGPKVIGKIREHIEAQDILITALRTSNETGVEREKELREEHELLRAKIKSYDDYNPNDCPVCEIVGDKCVYHRSMEQLGQQWTATSDALFTIRDQRDQLSIENQRLREALHFLRDQALVMNGMCYPLPQQTRKYEAFQKGERIDWVNVKELEPTIEALRAGLKLGEHCKLNPTAYVRQINEELTRLQQLVSK